MFSGRATDNGAVTVNRTSPALISARGVPLYKVVRPKLTMSCQMHKTLVQFRKPPNLRSVIQPKRGKNAKHEKMRTLRKSHWCGSALTAMKWLQCTFQGSSVFETLPSSAVMFCFTLCGFSLLHIQAQLLHVASRISKRTMNVMPLHRFRMPPKLPAREIKLHHKGDGNIVATRSHTKVWMPRRLTLQIWGMSWPLGSNCREGSAVQLAVLLEAGP